LCCILLLLLAAEDVRDAAYDAAVDTKKGARKAVIHAESAAEEGKAKSRGWLARLFGRGKVGKKQCECLLHCLLHFRA
jgi:hypothetical protein